MPTTLWDLCYNGGGVEEVKKYLRTAPREEKLAIEVATAFGVSERVDLMNAFKDHPRLWQKSDT